jgi:hypothetical protein
VVNDTQLPVTPDSIFPNNWVSFHEDGTVFTYPMFAENRRAEKRKDIFELLSDEFEITKISSFTEWEKENKFLEGTGSLILDREHKIVYAAISDRTHPDILNEFAQRMSCKVVSFHSNQTVGEERLPIYHTNVMMFVGDKVAAVCFDSIDDIQERKVLKDSLIASGKELVYLTEDQINHFAGNMLQVKTKEGKKLIVMSRNAYDILSKEQKDILMKHGKLVYSDLTTIETLGGGSARCMMAEVFLPVKS